ncbi:MAG: hypothetical protein WA269_06050 [Candidatus Udaeobacter sp.]
MKNQNIVFIAIAFALAFALAPVIEAEPTPQGGPDPVDLPVVTIHSTDNVTRGKIGAFVVSANPKIALATTFVNFSVSGTAIPGVDYTPLVPPASIGQAGLGVILVKTLPDPRASVGRQAQSIVVTLNPGLGYAVGKPNSAQMFIKP